MSSKRHSGGALDAFREEYQASVRDAEAQRIATRTAAQLAAYAKKREDAIRDADAYAWASGQYDARDDDMINSLFTPHFAAMEKELANTLRTLPKTVDELPCEDISPYERRLLSEYTQRLEAEETAKKEREIREQTEADGIYAHNLQKTLDRRYAVEAVEKPDVTTEQHAWSERRIVHTRVPGKRNTFQSTTHWQRECGQCNMVQGWGKKWSATNRPEYEDVPWTCVGIRNAHV